MEASRLHHHPTERNAMNAPAPKLKRGRKPAPGGCRRIQLSLDGETMGYVRELGIRNLSAWVRQAIADAWTRPR